MRVFRHTSYMHIIPFALLTFTCILHRCQVLVRRYVVVFQIVVSTMVQTQYNHLQHTWRCCPWNGSCIDFPFLVFLNLQHGATSVHRSIGSFKNGLVALQGQNDVTLVFKNRTLHWFLSWAKEDAYALMVEVVMKFAVWILCTCCDAKSHHALGNIWQPCKRRGANCAGCTTTQRLPPSPNLVAVHAAMESTSEQPCVIGHAAKHSGTNSVRFPTKAAAKGCWQATTALFSALRGQFHAVKSINGFDFWWWNWKSQRRVCLSCFSVVA